MSVSRDKTPRNSYSWTSSFYYASIHLFPLIREHVTSLKWHFVINNLMYLSDIITRNAFIFWWNKSCNIKIYIIMYNKQQKKSIWSVKLGNKKCKFQPGEWHHLEKPLENVAEKIVPKRIVRIKIYKISQKYPTCHNKHAGHIFYDITNPINSKVPSIDNFLNFLFFSKVMYNIQSLVRKG